MQQNAPAIKFAACVAAPTQGNGDPSSWFGRLLAWIGLSGKVFSWKFRFLWHPSPRRSGPQFFNKHY